MGVDNVDFKFIRDRRPVTKVAEILEPLEMTGIEKRRIVERFADIYRDKFWVVIREPQNPIVEPCSPTSCVGRRSIDGNVSPVPHIRDQGDTHQSVERDRPVDNT